MLRLRPYPREPFGHLSEMPDSAIHVGNAELGDERQDADESTAHDRAPACLSKSRAQGTEQLLAVQG